MPKSVHFALIASLGLAVAACQAKPDPKVAQLEQQLKDTQQQLAAAKDPQSGTAAGQTAAPPAAVDAAKPAEQPAAAAQNAGAAQPTATAAVAQATAEENARLKREIEDLKPREFTLPAGTVIRVRTPAEVSTARVKEGSVFDALLEKDLVTDGTLLAKAGSHVSCIVVSSDPGGRVKGVASLSVAARSISAVGNNTIAIKTASYTKDAPSTKKKDAVRTGVATGVGAAIGGIAGGGKGAAIGAGAGAAAGAGTTLATRGAAAVIPAETLIEFKLSAPATVTIRK